MPHPPTRQPLILVADDDPDILRMVERVLAPLGYRTVAAQSGEEAISKALHHHPDVILLDVVMPGLDGFETARRIRMAPVNAHTPIVMVTALCDTGDRIRALEAGADDILTKPVDAAELRARVKTLAQVKAHHDHLRTHQQELEAAVEARTRDLRIANEKVKAANLETICRLAAAAEFRDEDTGSHIVRIAYYAAALAQRAGMDKTLADTIMAAAPMHDIGKIGIPDRILLKPTRLDPDEWKTMQQHTTIGACILNGSSAETIRMGELIALTHHEKWDGSGYPQGLRGSDIPIAGRITAIVDVFDALSSKRPYRSEPVHPPEKAFAIIQEGRGTHFDPDLVDAFMAIADTVLEIKARYQDTGSGLLAHLSEMLAPLTA